VLEALSRQNVPGGLFETIVVDDASSDATIDVAGRSRGARLVEATGHVGVAASRNLGIATARGDVVAFVDADCVPAHDWVQRGLRALNQLKADLLAGRIEVAVDRPSSIAFVDLTHDFDQERYVAEGFGATGNLWVRRQIIERVGPFDERLARGEDTDFCRRAVAGGARLVYVPDLVVRHPTRPLRVQVRRSFAIGTDKGARALLARAREGAYVTPQRARTRLNEAGYRPTALRMLGIRLTKNVCIRLPMAAGAIWATLRSKAPGGTWGRACRRLRHPPS